MTRIAECLCRRACVRKPQRLMASLKRVGLVAIMLIVTQVVLFERRIDAEDVQSRKRSLPIHPHVRVPTVMALSSNATPESLREHVKSTNVTEAITNRETREEETHQSDPNEIGMRHTQEAVELDVFQLRRRAIATPEDIDRVCSVSPGYGPEGMLGFQGLSKIRVKASFNEQPDSMSTKLLCIVLTDSTQHNTTLQAILDTYAPRCDGFLAASNQTNHSLNAINVCSEPITGSNATIDLALQWSRFRCVWKYVHDNYGNSFDFFHFGPEDMYVIPQNLRDFISSLKDEELRKPLFLGGSVIASREFPHIRHCGGGAGVTINRKAQVLFLSRWDQCDLSTLMELPHNKKGKAMAIDRMMADCFALDDISCRNTLDSKSGIRYLEFGIAYQAQWSRRTKGPIKAGPLRTLHRMNTRQGIPGISESTISIHLVHGLQPLNDTTLADALRRFDQIVYRGCDEKWDHPYGALDADGKPGYVHDATYLRRNPLNLTFHRKGDSHSICQLPFGEDVEGKKGYNGLQKIRIMDELPLDGLSVSERGMKRRLRVMCIIYTHSGRHDRVRAIAETYASNCDGFMAASNLTDVTIGAVNLLHEGPELYANMWLKVRSIWQYVHTHYLNDFDFFQLGGDDHYVIPENLRYVASTGSWRETWNQSAPLYLGGSMVDYPRTTSRYCGGGAGYTLNVIALKLLVEELFDTTPCRPHFQAPDEDRIIAHCFRSIGILCMDTNDHLNETRYHASDVNFHARWNYLESAPWRHEPLEKFHGIASKEGLGQVSETSVSFHLKGRRRGYEDRGIRRYHAILYGLCNTTERLEISTKSKTTTLLSTKLSHRT